MGLNPQTGAADASRRQSRRGLWLALLMALGVVLPLLTLAVMAWQPAPEIWPHLQQVVLPGALRNTAWVLAGTVLACAVLGVSLAWLTAVCEFPLRRLAVWALLLPLALPAYVQAFVQVGLFDFAGPLQTALRNGFGPELRLPPIRSLPGLVLVFTLALYPYVYMLAYNAFASHGLRGLEAAQTLGCTRWRAFWRVALPQARPWIIGGLMLVAMEVLADFGTVSVFNIDTLTTAIYKAWFQLFSLDAAARIALWLALLALLLVAVEQRARGQRRYAVRPASAERLRLRGWQAAAATAWCGLVLAAALLLPLAQLLVWAWAQAGAESAAQLIGYCLHSLGLGLAAALLCVLAALLLAWLRRHQPQRATQILVRLALLGYALPGSVLAVGIFVPLAWLDRQILPLLQALGLDVEMLMRGSLLALLIALAVRFLAVAFQPIDAQLQRVTAHQEDAALSLGLSRAGLLWRFYPGALRPGLLAAILLVSIDVIKEIPITLMMRPFGWDTLSLRIFEMTSEGMWERAATPALLTVVCSLIPVILLARRMMALRTD